MGKARNTHMQQVFEPKLTPEEYSRILDKLELRAVLLDKLKATVDRETLHNANNLPVIIEENNTYEMDNDFIVHATLKALCTTGKRKCFTVSAEYTVVFDTEEDISQEFFEIFSVLNLPLTTWPFFRELVNSTTARMGIPPLTLPLHRSGITVSSNK